MLSRHEKKLLESYRELLEEFRVKLEDAPDTEYQRIKAVILFIKERLIKPLEVAEDKLKQPSKREYL
ncbi:MAG: hypothetical protein AAB922_03200 [Patescibacteria group bacterium]